MKIETLISVLNAALQKDTLSLTDPVTGLSWTSDLKTVIGNNFQLTALQLVSAGNKATAAQHGAVQNASGVDLPSVVLFGSPNVDVLNVPKAQIELTLYATPVNINDDANTEVDFTLLVQIKTADWTPADSFPELISSFVFSHLIATQAPSFLLTSFAHQQQWTLGGPSNNFSNNFPALEVGLNLQVPCGLPTEAFSVLEDLFGDLGSSTFYFNGPIAYSKSSKNAPQIEMLLLAELGGKHNLSFTGNSPITLEFDAGFEAYTATSDTADPTQNAPLLVTQLVLQTLIGHARIQALIPLDGSSLSFSMNGLDDQPAISMEDIASLFNQSSLFNNLPDSIQKTQSGDDFFKQIGIQNVELDIDIPQSGKPEISSIALSVGYAKGPAVQYQGWFELESFVLHWQLNHPFPTTGAQSLISLNGDFTFLNGEIDFEASFNPSDGNSEESAQGARVFVLQGGLVEPSVIQLSDLFKQFSAHSEDFPEISIDGLSFYTAPENKHFSASIDLEIDWKFQNFTAPQIKGLSADVDVKGTDISGKINAEIEIGTDEDAPVFEFSGERSSENNAWIFTAHSDHPFTIGELADGFGFDHPDYLNDISIVQTSVSYIAPIGNAQSASLQAQNKATDAPPESTFQLIIEAKFPIAGENLDLTLTYQVDQDAWELKGKLIVSPPGQPTKSLEFDFDANGKKGDPKKQETTLVAILQSANQQPLNISDFAAAFGAPAPPIPDALNDLELVRAKIEYKTGTAGKGLLLTATSQNYGQLVFAIVKTGTDSAAVWKPFFALQFNPVLDFSKLPVIGTYIKRVANVELKQIQVVGFSKAMSAQDLNELNTLLQNVPAPVPLIPKVDDGQCLPPEVIFNAVLSVNGEGKTINLVLNGNGISKGGNTAGRVDGQLLGEAANIPANNGKQAIDKTFGPVHLSGFNIGYSNGKIGLDISGELTLGGIAMSVQGMGIKMKFPPQSIDDVSFQLHGLGINVDKGGMRIAGGFISLDDNYDNFMGMLVITAGSMGMQAYGGYATTTPEPSFFIFVNVEVPLGGPPFFFIDGLAGGFGLNRQFIMPDFQTLPTFPLLPGVSSNPIPSDAPNNLQDITKVLSQLANFIPPKDGAYWIAAGLDFTSFELIQVTAILEVSFGAGFQIGLIGSAALSIPEPEEPIAFVQLDFEVNFDSTAGFFAVLAELTPASYVFSGSCHLTGGFAFYVWYQNQSSGAPEGDFVVSIGGYHPAFTKPAWYPSVSRLGMNWDLGPLKITGQSYFALTPHVLMAGLELSAIFDIKVVKATFDAGFDFILGWKPFFYLADAFIHINIELHLIFTLHFHVGVDMEMWGPEFGGKARVDLSVFSFTIHFGSDAPTPPPIPWSEFRKMLPNAQPQTQSAAPLMRENQALAATQPFSVSHVELAKGLIQSISDQPLQASDMDQEKIFNWQIDPNDFSFILLAGVPSNNFWFNNQSNNGPSAVNARARPSDFTPTPGSNGIYVKTDEESNFYLRPEGKDSPETIFAYDIPEDPWWKQCVRVGPVNIAKGEFKNGTRETGFASTFIVNVYSLSESGNGIEKVNENNFVVTLLTKNAAKSLWGAMVNVASGNAALNDTPLLNNTLFGLTLTPKIWNPLQTREINIYLLLFNDGNNLCWPAEAGPSVAPNTFDETISPDGKSMTFKLPSGVQVQSRFRQLSSQAFGNIDSGHSLIENLNSMFGFGLVVSTDVDKLAEPMYQDWPIMALTGEESAAACNQ